MQYTVYTIYKRTFKTRLPNFLVSQIKKLVNFLNYGIIKVFQIIIVPIMEDLDCRNSNHSDNVNFVRVIEY